MHARVVSETDARKGLLGHWCAQPKRPFWRMQQRTFGQRICARYGANPGCAQPTSRICRQPLWPFEMLCKLDSTENARSFEQNSTLPWLWAGSEYVCLPNLLIVPRIVRKINQSTEVRMSKFGVLSCCLIRPTQSIIHVPLQVHRFKKNILLIVQYKYLKSCSRRFYSPESDPPHKIMRYDVYYSTQLCCWFPPDRNLSGGNDLYWRCTRFEKAFRRGRALNILHDS